MFIYFWERERESVSGGEVERGRHRIWCRLQALSCQHIAWCGTRTHRPPDHDLSRSQMLNWLSHPGTPEHTLLCISFLVCYFVLMSIFWLTRNWVWKTSENIYHNFFPCFLYFYKAVNKNVLCTLKDILFLNEEHRHFQFNSRQTNISDILQHVLYHIQNNDKLQMAPKYFQQTRSIWDLNNDCI